MKFTIVFLIYYNVVKQTRENFYWLNEHEIPTNNISGVQTNSNVYVQDYRNPRVNTIQNTPKYPMANYNVETSKCNYSRRYLSRVEPETESTDNMKIPAYPILYENQQETIPNTASIVNQSSNDDYRFAPNQYHHLYSSTNPELQESNTLQPQINNTNQFVNNQYTVSNNGFNIEDTPINKTNQQKPLYNAPVKNIHGNLYCKPVDLDILNKLKDIWTSYIEKALNNTDYRILQYFEILDVIEDWKKINYNAEMFHTNIRHRIEFHIPTIFQDVIIFRQKSLEKIRYNYLFVKGDPKKHLKNLHWRGTKIFIMDCSGIGNNVTLNGNTYIGPNCKIGNKTLILSNCFLKKNVEIQNETFISKKNFFGENCKIGTINIAKKNMSCDENLQFLHNEGVTASYIQKKKYKTKIMSNNFFSINSIVPYEYCIRNGNFIWFDYHSANR